jgi:2-(1,2-epoxy-1,2-dihydrophenyl)acetyl-CoA isomerase
MAVHVDERMEGQVRILSLDIPASRNALSPAVRLDLLAALENALSDPKVRVLVITGAGGVFCAGGDIDAMVGINESTVRERMLPLHRIVTLMIDADKPVIAAVEGWAAGGGLSLSLLCDHIVAARGAQFQGGFERMGLVGDLGICWTLPRKVGLACARDLLIFGKRLDATEAHRLSLVDTLCDDGQALACALDIAEKLCSVSGLALAASKSLLAASDQPLVKVLELEANTQAGLVGSAEFKLAVEHFIAAKQRRLS